MSNSITGIPAGSSVLYYGVITEAFNPQNLFLTTATSYSGYIASRTGLYLITFNARFEPDSNSRLVAISLYNDTQATELMSQFVPSDGYGRRYCCIAHIAKLTAQDYIYIKTVYDIGYQEYITGWKFGVAYLCDV